MNKERVYVTGSAGLVGSRFVEKFNDKYNLLTPEIDELNILNKEVLDSFFQKEKPGILVHFAAYTNVGEAEKQRGDKNGICYQVNVLGTENLARVSKKFNVFMVYISTDMVFPGSAGYPGPYNEEDEPETDSNKLTWYGFTKGEGERKLVDVLGKNSVILRIIYPVRARFSGRFDYLRKPLKFFDEGKLYPLFYDQQVSIAFVDEIVSVIDRIISKKKTGVFHASSRDITSPYEIVSYLIEKTRGKKNVVEKSSLGEFLKKVDNPIRYPKYGGLKVERTEKQLGIKFSTWKEIINKLVEQGIGDN